MHADNDQLDYSGQSNTGTCTGTCPPISTPGTTSSVGGQFFTFDGSSRYLSTASSLISGNSDFTFSAWVKTSASGSRQDLLDVGTNTPYAAAMFFINPNGTVEIDYAYSVGPASTLAVNDGNWHHVAAVKTGSIVQIYVDGIASGSAIAPVSVSDSLIHPLNVDSGGSTTVGAYLDKSTYFFNGSIDELSVWNRALNESDIAKIYYMQKP